jgi:hypothetical protein
MKTCFSIMPFAVGFKEIAKIIQVSAEKCGLEYVRGDLSARPGIIMSQIVHEVSRASVVVADITGHNPNVLYELGIAHQILGPERVVIITQPVDGKKAFDVDHLYQLIYAHNPAGRMKLRNELPQLIHTAAEKRAQHEFWNVIKGCLPRTLMLVRDLERFIETAEPRKLNGAIIRIAAMLSSIAISDNEPGDPKVGIDYRNALIAERNLLRKALLKGVRLKAVLNPPRRFTQALLPARLRVRYERLIGLLEGRSDIRRNPKAAAEDVRAIKRCEFALSPVPSPNVFIIGDQVAYEGMKRGGAGGFEMTHCETSPEGLRELIEQFDRFYEDSRQEMIRAHPPDGRLAEQLKNFYREATESA